MIMADEQLKVVSVDNMLDDLLAKLEVVENKNRELQAKVDNGVLTEQQLKKIQDAVERLSRLVS